MPGFMLKMSCGYAGTPLPQGDDTGGNAACISLGKTLMNQAKPSIPELLRIRGPHWRERFAEADEVILHAILESPFSPESTQMRAEIILQSRLLRQQHKLLGCLSQKYITAERKRINGVVLLIWCLLMAIMAVILTII